MDTRTQTILFAIVVVVISYLSGYVEDFYENIFDFFSDLWEDFQTLLTNYQKESLYLVTPAFFLLVVIYLVYNYLLKKETRRYTCSYRVSVEEYNKEKEILTAEALEELQVSSEYENYLKKKESNTLEPIELNESDRIEFSDESEVEDEIAKKEDNSDLRNRVIIEEVTA